MSTVTIKIKTDNAAFADGSEGYETARILRKYADLLEDLEDVREADETPAHDYNGNRVGTLKVSR